MKKRNHPKHFAAPTAEAISPQVSLLYILLTIACVGFLAVGFFFAAKQHFAAMELGMKNSKLRKQIEDMESQNRQLLLAREIVRSPSEIKRTAFSKGFRDSREMPAAIAVRASVPPVKKDLPTASPVVVKTGDVRPVLPVKAFFPVEKRAAKPALDAIRKSSASTVNPNTIAKLR